MISVCIKRNQKLKSFTLADPFQPDEKEYELCLSVKQEYQTYIKVRAKSREAAVEMAYENQHWHGGGAGDWVDHWQAIGDAYLAIPHVVEVK